MSETVLSWVEPLTFAAQFAGRDMALLYSGVREQYSGRYSYLFVDPIEERAGTHWKELPPLPTQGNGLPLWVGYVGYGMRELASRGGESPITLPDFRLVRYATTYRFDHESQAIIHYGDSPTRATMAEEALPALLHLGSNFTRTAYEKIVRATIAEIMDGNFYQANITRKFYGQFARAPNSWQLFTKLCAASPAPYSGYIKHRKNTILSSSPECFLNVDAAGVMTTRPIKGSARRNADAAEDKKIRETLASSAKNHAENLMIVDLMRNDLSRVAAPESVKVTEQSQLYSYATIHHLISTITAQKAAGVSCYDAVRACFPAGSMTGAPKIAAMKWCAAQEKLERGVYSGAIGWFGAGDVCDLSVVIRTLILEGDRFEFQVGGGIVADSTPEDEWRETLAKARGILAALELTEADIAKL